MSNDYPYSTYILPPEKLGASPNPKALGNDVKALAAYVQVLVSGRSKAQKVSPLGNKYFMDTGGKCKDEAGVEHTRYVYINNVPDGNIPFISSAMGETMSSFQGLVPGMLGNMAYINPAKIFNAFAPETTCQKIKMPIRDISNNTTEEERYVNDSDIKDYNPCWFSSKEISKKKSIKKNPVTNVVCSEGMATRTIQDDKMVQVYTASIYLLAAYLLFRLVRK
jgi:hypothetical protein